MNVVAYLHDTQQRLTLIASAPGDPLAAQHEVEQAAYDWLQKNEPDSESCLVVAVVLERIEVGDFVMRGPTPPHGVEDGGPDE